MQVTICEIDQMVIDVSKKFLPHVAQAWDHPKVNLICGDAVEYMKRDECKNKFDVIVCDSSDPVGPAEFIFELPFYLNMRDALKPGGVICTQVGRCVRPQPVGAKRGDGTQSSATRSLGVRVLGWCVVHREFLLPHLNSSHVAFVVCHLCMAQAESMWNNLDLIQKLIRSTMPSFECVEYATTQIPTYPLGQIGFLLCRKAGQPEPVKTHSVPVRAVSAEQAKLFRYYTSKLHSAAFVLPAFLEQAIEEARAADGKDQ